MLINLHDARKASLAGAAALTLAAFAPLSGASAGSYNLHFDDHEDLLEQIIELDAEGIANLRADLTEARADIADAIRDIEDAKEDVKEVPFGGMVAKVAFRAASATVSKATETALDEVRDELVKAERELGARRTDLGEAEYMETSDAITMIRKELKSLEDALEDLTDALKEA